MRKNDDPSPVQSLGVVYKRLIDEAVNVRGKSSYRMDNMSGDNVA